MEELVMNQSIDPSKIRVMNESSINGRTRNENIENVVKAGNDAAVRW